MYEWEKVYIYMYEWEEFSNVHLLMTEFDSSEVTLFGWEDGNIQYLTNQPTTN